MKAWDNFLKEIERELGVDTVNKWLRTLHVVRYDARNLYLEAKDAFQALWFDEHIRKKTEVLLLNNNRKQIRVHLKIASNSPKQKMVNRKKEGKHDSEPPLPKFTPIFDEPNQLYTFGNFVDSESNVLAYKLLCKITNYDPVSGKIIPSNSELSAFNPLYLHGSEGTGKTHLLMATACALKERGLTVLYARAETFTEHVIKAMRGGEMSLFRHAYRNIDVLLIDDVHVFSRKVATQEEFFHTFNTLHLAGKQIILSANCSPAELQHIEPRLISRFEWGIVLPLETLQPNEVTRVLERKAKSLQVPLSPKVQDYLVSTFTSSMKSLTKALEALLLRHHLQRQNEKHSFSSITVKSAQHLLADLIHEEKKCILTAEKIVEKVANQFGIKPKDILSKAQSRDCVLPRHIAMHLCRHRLRIPYTKIGEIFSRDHSTVMSSVKLIQKGVDSVNQQITAPYNSIVKQLNP